MHSIVDIDLAPVSDYPQQGQFNRQHLVYIFVGHYIDKQQELYICT